MKKLHLLVICALGLYGYRGSAQTFTPIDINTGSGNSTPNEMVEYKGKVYFNATTPASGFELWSSDGTQAGTSMVKEVHPGANYGFAQKLTVCNDLLFFVSNDSMHGAELWVSDGTTAGTAMLADIYRGAFGSDVDCLTPFGNKLYFTANDSVHGVELWVSDGTPAGTSIIKDIRPGLASSVPQAGNTVYGFTNKTQFNIINGKFYFNAIDGVHGSELWSSDGTSVGTMMVADLLPGPGSSNPILMTEFNGRMIFFASDSIHGREIWTSDGTAAGSSMLKDINPGTMTSSSGATGGLVVWNGKIYFTATQAATGTELWSTDGTTLGTTMVADILPGPGSSFAGTYGFAPYRGKIYFYATDSIHSGQLWATDGTTTGTALFKTLSTDGTNALPYGFVIYNSELTFIAGLSTADGRQLWATDGTPTGTRVIAPAIAPNTAPLLGSSSLGYRIVSQGSLFVTAGWTGIGYELWTYTTVPTAITEASEAHMISVYPNPFSGGISLAGLETNEHYDVEVMDATGRNCYRHHIAGATDEMSLTMPDLSAGVYLMQVAGQTGSQTFKLVKN